MGDPWGGYPIVSRLVRVMVELHNKAWIWDSDGLTSLDVPIQNAESIIKIHDIECRWELE